MPYLPKKEIKKALAFIGMVIGFWLIIMGNHITALSYETAGVVFPVCEDTVSCAVNALYNCTLYLLTVLGAAILALCMGIFMGLQNGRKKTKDNK